MPRHGENIYKRSDGRWEGRYHKGKKGGKVVYGYVYAPTYQLVKEKLACINSVPKAEEKFSPSGDSLADICEKWLLYKQISTKASTFMIYKSIVTNHILSYFGDILIWDMTTDLFQNYITFLQSEKLSEKSISDIICVMKSVLRYAEKLNIHHNCNLSAVSVKVYHRDIRVFSPEEFKVMTAYFLNEKSPMNCAMLIAMFTGMRIGELCALKYEDIDIRHRKLTIDKTMQRLKNADGKGTFIHIGTPKSRSSVREIPLTDFLLELISEQNYSAGDYILTANENYIEPRALQYRFSRIMKKFDIDGASFHTLRHSFATRCVEVGFDIKSLSEILGHSNVNITLNRYVHSSFDLKARNMKKMDVFISHSPSE